MPAESKKCRLPRTFPKANSISWVEGMQWAPHLPETGALADAACDQLGALQTQRMEIVAQRDLQVLQLWQNQPDTSLLTALLQHQLPAQQMPARISVVNSKAVFCDHKTCSLQNCQCPNVMFCTADAASILLAWALCFITSETQAAGWQVTSAGKLARRDSVPTSDHGSSQSVTLSG